MDSTSLELDHHHHTRFLITKGRRTKRQRSSTVTSTSSSHAGGGASGGDGGARSDNDYYSSSSTATQPDHDTASHVTVTAEEDMANCLILLAQGINRRKLSNPTATTTSVATATTTATAIATSVYECKTCNRIFPSFQALGGHRASHKKPKPNPNPKPNPIPAVSSPSDRDIVDDEDESESTNHKTNNSTNLIRSNVINDVSKGMIMRVHECSICGSEFPSGQALGGHMRRHRAPPLPAADRPIPINGGGPRIGLPPLDLNLPAPSDDHQMIDDHMETKFHVLPTPALVDCHY